jgi:tetratricopeptide (TPR) repeat protein
MTGFRTAIGFVLVFSILVGICPAVQRVKNVANATPAREHAKHGDVLFGKKEYQRAAESYDRALRLDPDLISAYITRGRCWHELRKYRKAIDDFSEALRRDPKNSEAYRLRAGARFAKATITRRGSQNPGPFANAHSTWLPTGERASSLNKVELEGAVDDLDKAVKFDPQNAENFVGRGMGQFQLRHDREAIRDFSHAIELNPKSGAAFLYRAMARFRLEEFESALSDFNAVLSLDDARTPFPRAAVYPMRAGALMALNRFDDALADSAKLVRLYPKKPAGYALRAIILDAKGDKEKLFQTLSRGISAVPAKDAAPLYLLRGKAHESKKEYRKALADFTVAANLGGKDADVACNRAAYIFATCPDESVRNYGEAVKFAQRTYELVKGKDWKAIAMLATAYAQAGEFADAVKWQQKAVEKAPASAVADLKYRLKLYRDGKSYYGRGKTSK